MTASSASILKKTLLVFLAVTALYFAREFLIPVAIAAILSALFQPFCTWLEKYKIPRIITPFICLLGVIGFAALLFFLVGWQINTLTEEASVIKQKGLEYFAKAQQYVYDLAGISKEEQIKMLKEQQSAVSAMIAAIAGSLFTVLTNGILVMVYVFLFLYYRNHLKQFVIKLAKPEQKSEAEKVVNKAANVAQQYLTGLAKMIFCLWILYGIGFSVLGVPNAIFFAVLCGILEIIPFIGNLTGTTITLLVSAVQGATPGVLLGIIIVYAVVQFIQGWVLESLIVGPHVKINPLFTILALVLGELLWGIAGVVLAIPALAVIKIICDHVEPLKPYGFLIGEVGERDEKQNWLSKWLGRRKK